jgi:hypothetical protein
LELHGTLAFPDYYYTLDGWILLADLFVSAQLLDARRMMNKKNSVILMREKKIRKKCRGELHFPQLMPRKKTCSFISPASSRYIVLLQILGFLDTLEGIQFYRENHAGLQGFIIIRL